MAVNRRSEFEFPLSVVRERIANSDLVPGCYARYRAVVADTLEFFLQRLSSARLRQILVEQMHLAPAVSTAERVVALLGHSPVLHKLGQVIARDRRLTKGFRHQLQKLESLVPKTSIASATRQIDSQCRNWKKAGIRLEPQPLAEGSVAVVIPFAWVNGSTNVRQGVFKVLKAGVRSRLEEDLEILSLLATFFDERCDDYGLPVLDYQDTFETIRQLLRHEVRFEQEQQNLAEAAKAYSRTESVVIPALLPFCSAGLTAMERLRGHRIPAGTAGDEKSFPRASARTIVEALVAQPIFSPGEAALFHADPHGGNLLFMPGSRVGILDWSLTGRLPRDQRFLLVQLILAAWVLDIWRMEWAVRRLAQKIPHQACLSKVLRSGLRELRWGTFPGLTWLTRLLDELTLRVGLRFSPDLLLFRKSLLTLEGLLADLLGEDSGSPQTFLDIVVTGTFLNHWLKEWPARFLMPMNATSATTHISTADLLALAWSSAGTFARWWSQGAVEWLDRRDWSLLTSTSTS
jgi:ubiquinone biosynthesis protein